MMVNHTHFIIFQWRKKDESREEKKFTLSNKILVLFVPINLKNSEPPKINL